MTWPYDVAIPLLKDIQSQAPQAICETTPLNASRNLIINRKVAPFDNPEIRRAILSHADFTGVPRESLLEKTLFACDEMAGFLTACSYVKPGRSIHEVETKSVRKKLKDKAFARSVSRDDIMNGAAGLNVDLDQHIEFCIQAMQQRAAGLGLEGTAAESSSEASTQG